MSKKPITKNEKPKTNKEVVRFPASVLAPLAKFLRTRLVDLKKHKKEIEKEDPFKDTGRLLDNASPDTEAAEQFGHARTSAIRTELGKRIIETRKALTRIKIGKYGICEDCGKMIDTDRLMIYPEATLCAEDAVKREQK